MMPCTSQAVVVRLSISIPTKMWPRFSNTSGARKKVVGAICHGAIALGNIPDRVRGRRTTGYTLEGDKELQRMFGSGFLIPHFPADRSGTSGLTLLARGTETIPTS